MSLRACSLPPVELDVNPRDITRAPEEVVMITNELLATCGWCLWRCKNLDNDIVVVSLDYTVKGFPSNYPVYTLAELDLIRTMNDGMLQYLHEAKKCGGAIIEEVKR